MGKKKRKDRLNNKKSYKKEKDLLEQVNLVSLSSLISNFLMFYFRDNNIYLSQEVNSILEKLSLYDFENDFQIQLDKFIKELKVQSLIKINNNENKNN